MKKWLLLTLPIGFLTGCATVPQDLQGTYAPIVPSSSQNNQSVQPVRWGGVLIKTEPTPDNHTCFEVLSQPLNSEARPIENSQSLGRFTACAVGFYDPEVYKSGRDITFVGTLNGVVAHQVGQALINEPLLNATAVHLWNIRPPIQYYNNAPFGYMGPPYFGYPDGYWGNRFYGPSPIFYSRPRFNHPSPPPRPPEPRPDKDHR